MKNLPNLIFALKGLCSNQLKISIVIPVFNQELRILSNIRSILECLSLPHELIIINDASNDKSLEELKKGLPEIIGLSKYSKKFTLWHFNKSHFETHCDSAGIYLSEAEYVLEIQADMIIHEYGFDKKMLKAIKLYPDILMLSGRGTHKIDSFCNRYKTSLGAEGSGKTFTNHIKKRIFGRLKKYIKNFTKKNTRVDYLSNQILDQSHNDRIFPDLTTFLKTGKAGRLSSDVERDFSFCENKIWLSETVMRGPLLIDKSKYYEIGGFDFDRFFQGFDDMDLCLRAWFLRSYRSGFVAIKFISPLEDGSMRKQKTFRQELEFVKNLLRIKNSWKESTLFKYHELIKNKPITCEIREF